MSSARSQQKLAAACKAMKAYDIAEYKTKSAIKELLELYNGKWKLIEDGNYNVLFEYIVAKNQEDIKGVKSKKKETMSHAEPQEYEPLVKRLRSRKQKEYASTSTVRFEQIMGKTPSEKEQKDVAGLLQLPQTSSDSEDCQPLLKRSRRGQRIEEASPSLDNGNRIMMLTSSGKVHEYENEMSCSSQSNPASEDCQSPLVSLLPWHQKGNAPNSMKNSNTQIVESKSRNLGPGAVEIPQSSLREGIGTKENCMQISESNFLSAEVKSEGGLNLSQFEIASSVDGEVKVFLGYKSPRQSGIHVSQLEIVLEQAKKKCCESYKIMEPSFSVKNVMKDLIDCFTAVKTNHVDGELVRCETASPVYDTSNRSNARVISQELNQRSKSCINIAVEKHSLARCIIKPFAYVDDISRGEESVKVSLVNGSKAEDFPTFLYISKNAIFNKACVNFNLASIADEDCCLQCSDNCLLSCIPCQCAKQTGGEFAYTPGGLLKDIFLEDFISSNHKFEKKNYFFCRDCPLERFKGRKEIKSCKGHLERRFIKECWTRCGCSNRCGNRIVQRGISVALQVFQTLEGKSWGVRTVNDLPKGAFVCEYVGEIVTNCEMHERKIQGTFDKKHTFPVPLDADWYTEGILKDEKALYLDCTSYGNVSRFINHRCCDANLIGIPVEVESPDHHYYHLAFFTTRNIAAMEELTLDYGIKFGDQDQLCKPFKCLCGSAFCRDIGQ